MSSGWHNCPPSVGVAETEFGKYLDEVCFECGYATAQILGDNRSRDLVELRHLMMCVARYEYDMKVVQIGKLFNRDHTSVLYACKAIKSLWDLRDPQPLSFSLRQCLQTSEKIFHQIWGHHFNTVCRWHTIKK